MKILITFYSLNNLGGILNNNENLTAGLRELGHEVTNRQLVWKESIQTNNTRRRLASETGAMGIPFDQELGWKWPGSMRFPYKGKYNLQRWKEYAGKFDLIIWQIPVPTVQSQNRGNTDWLELYDVPVKQIVYTHDGNMIDSYPWIYAIKDKLCGAVGVHPCAYHALKHLPLPRAMAFSAQKDIDARIAAADAVDPSERAGWFSLQTFKGWKHVDDIVRAIPHMENDEPKRLAGGGLHYYYMTSDDKIKDAYIASKSKDPNMYDTWNGFRIWDLAKEHGMEYLGYIRNHERDEKLRRAKFIIDPSWSKKYASIGDHFNRTSVEGIISGAVPIARNYGVATNRAGEGEFFKPNENYLMIPWDATPKQFAILIDDYINMPQKDRLDLLENGRQTIVPLFDYRKVAQTFIDVADGKPAGVYNSLPIGEYNPDMEASSKKVIEEFFAA